jgi:hypothetical protein
MQFHDPPVWAAGSTKGGGGFQAVGGAPLAAFNAAARAVPGVGQAAHVAMHSDNRTMAFAGQAAAIGC